MDCSCVRFVDGHRAARMLCRGCRGTGFAGPPAAPPARGLAQRHAVREAWGRAYFTAPKVRPWTSCFWLNQPNTTIGAMAISEAADSLAQNRPSGLE
jgi:hypothetical protein